MTELCVELSTRSRGDSADVASPILVHSLRNESLAERTQHMIASKPEVVIPANESVGNKLVREAQVLTYGIGGAFEDVATNPISKLPEVATAGAFGVGINCLQKAGTSGKVMAGVFGAGVMAKMGYDEWTGNRWSEFGESMSAAWDSKANFYSSVQSTKHSVGSLAVDLTVSGLAYKAVGVYDPIGPRSSSMSRGDIGMSFLSPARESFSRVPELSLMGDRCSRALGEPSLPLRTAVKPPKMREFSLLGEKSTTALGEATAKHERINIFGAAPEQIDRFEKLERAVEATKPKLSDGLKSKLLTGKPEEFGYLSAIREVAAVESEPDFRPTRGKYETVANTLETMSRDADKDFAQKYHEVASMIRKQAAQLPDN